MTKDKRCIDCHQKTYERLSDKFHLSKTQKAAFSVYFNMAVAAQNSGLQRRLQNKFSLLSGVDDPYIEEKKISNDTALGLYKQWQPKIIQSAEPFDMALRLAIAGNIMDLGANCALDIYDSIDSVFRIGFAIDHSALLKQRIKEAKNILYIGDNAGEIVFDKLFLEIMMHHNVTYAVKDEPIINDATIVDAIDVGMASVADVITIGYNIPTALSEQSSHEFRHHYDKADLIISKGQGNFEGLLPLQDERVFFLLMAKCEVIADKLQVPVNSFIVFNPTYSFSESN
jgi:hypothetical protein